MPYTAIEASVAAGTGAAVFITAMPPVSAYAGVACVHFLGSSVGCGLTTPALSGTSSRLCTSSLTYYITQKRYKKCLRDNAGKYVRNNINDP